MLIVYGSACLAVVILSLLDRRSLPYSITLAGGWLLGFLPLEVWWFISLGQGAGFTCFLRWHSPYRFKIIASCVIPMLMCDALYWGLKHNGIVLDRPYEIALNVLLTVQLALTASFGGGRLVGLGVSLLGRLLAGLGGVGGIGAAARGQNPAGRDGASRGFWA